jgi:hypothetical protein
VASPGYDAVIWLEPTAREDVVSVATLPDVVPVPIGFPSAENVTVSPSGTAGVVVAVNVTGWPTADGLGEDESVVVVVIWLTVCVSGVDVLVA